MNQPIPETMHRGHIPGSKNVRESNFINEMTNTFLPPEEISKGKVAVFCGVLFRVVVNLSFQKQFRDFR